MLFLLLLGEVRDVFLPSLTIAVHQNWISCCTLCFSLIFISLFANAFFYIGILTFCLIYV